MLLRVFFILLRNRKRTRTYLVSIAYPYKAQRFRQLPSFLCIYLTASSSAAAVGTPVVFS